MRLSLCLDPGRSWADLARLARAADEGGWHALYVCDHFMPHRSDDAPASGPMLECWTTLSALAVATARTRLGPLVLGNTYRHPAVVANMAATLDQVSAGRVVLGLGAGWQRNEHQAYGIGLPPAADRIDALDEACGVVRRMLEQDEVTSDGRFYRLAGARCEPKPVQPSVPLLIGGSSARLLQVAARHADVWHMWADPSQFAVKSRALDQRCADLGRDPATLQRATGGTVDVLPLGVHSTGAAEEADVVGDVEEVVGALRRYAAAGAHEFVVVDDAGSTTTQQAVELVDLLQRDVAPLVT